MKFSIVKDLEKQEILQNETDSIYEETNSLGNNFLVLEENSFVSFCNPFKDALHILEIGVSKKISIHEILETLKKYCFSSEIDTVYLSNEAPDYLIDLFKEISKESSKLSIGKHPFGKPQIMNIFRL